MIATLLCVRSLPVTADQHEGTPTLLAGHALAAQPAAGTQLVEVGAVGACLIHCSGRAHGSTATAAAATAAPWQINS